MEISVLTPAEVEAHDLLIHLVSKLKNLPGPSKMKVYKRWLMLHMLTERELKNFDRWFERVTDDSAADRRRR